MSLRTRYYYANDETITVTAPFDCVIEIDLWLENQWPYGGDTVEFGVTNGGLSSEYEIVGKLYSGNTVGRTAHAKRVVSGAKAGRSYTFALTVSYGSFGSGQALKSIEAKCHPA